MVNQSVFEQLENVKDFMRPWVYQLVQRCLTKATQENDERAISSFLYVCNVSVLMTQSDTEQFNHVREELFSSPEKIHYLEFIHEAFQEVHGDVEGF